MLISSMSLLSIFYFMRVTCWVQFDGCVILFHIEVNAKSPFYEYENLKQLP